MSRTMARRFLITLCTTAFAVLLSVPALAASGRSDRTPWHAQPASGKLTALTGQVRDGRPLQRSRVPAIAVPGGLPVIRGAVVSLPGLGRQTTTNASGYFAIRGLRVSAGSTYTLIVQKKGFGRWKETGIKLIPGMPAEIYVELHSAPQSLQTPRPVRQPYNGPSRTRARPQTSGACGSNSSGWTSQSEQPPMIRVYITGQHGPTDAGQILDYDFSFYEQHVLPNEWEPDWKEAALEAGSVAVRDYAWYFILHGSKGTGYGDPNPCSYDVDDYVDYQDFDPFAATYASTNAAVNNTEYYLYTHNSAIPETGYNSGSPTDSCGEDNGVRETGIMSQWGSQACAQDGDSWQTILATYYDYNLAIYGSRGPAAGVDGSGKEYVFWENTGGGLEETYYNGSSWVKAAQVPGMGPLGSSPTVAVAPGGNQYVFWEGTGPGHDLYEAYYNGSAWNGPIDLGDGPLGSAPTAGVDSSGKEYVFWENTNGGLEETYYNGSSWVKAAQVPGMGPLGSSPTVAVAPGGNQYVFWQGTGSSADLYEAYYNGNGWNGPIYLGDGPLGSAPTAGVDSSGKEYVLWENTNGGLEETYYNGSVWNGPIDLSDGPLGSAPTVAVAPGGNQYVFWKGTGSSADLYEAYYNGSAWNGPIDLGDGPLG